MWIKIGVQDVSPITLVTFRILFGFLGLLIPIALYRQPIPHDRRTILSYVFMGSINVIAPWLLITWGETRIHSGLASILNGTQPFFVILIAHYWLHDEKITLGRVAGLVIGFIGVIVLLSKDLFTTGFHGDFAGQLAVVVAAASYAVANVFARRFLRNQPPVLQSTMMLFFANLLMLPIGFGFQYPVKLPSLPITWIAFAWLGLLGSCVAYLLYFRLLNEWGATRASMVTYALPVVGLLLGIFFLGETLDWRIILGMLLVMSGTMLVNLKPRRQVRVEELPIEA